MLRIAVQKTKYNSLSQVYVSVALLCPHSYFKNESRFFNKAKTTSMPHSSIAVENNLTMASVHRFTYTGNSTCDRISTPVA